ncbi:MAG: tRNA pseudouridine(38-40) synthase TruA [Nitrospirota bacterium]|nr:tRNA pseudouridine(38-40) synthase TruA [Nitrospirota bacterium]
MLRNIKIVLEYDGTNYHGWQSQEGSGKTTIQQTIEKALHELCGEKVKITSSGRTDAGVHAFGHVANFNVVSLLPPSAWAPALNRLLPADIRVLFSGEVPGDFHARFSAQGKIYCYRILNRKAPSALYRDRVWNVDRKLNVSAMRRAAEVLIGRHDFSSFRSSGCGAKTAIRTLKTLSVTKHGDLVEIRLEADAFLMHMARNIVGTLVEAGLGRFSASDVSRILKAKDRTKAGKTAPACGLYLQEVHYPDEMIASKGTG